MTVKLMLRLIRFVIVTGSLLFQHSLAHADRSASPRPLRPLVPVYPTNPAPNANRDTNPSGGTQVTFYSQHSYPVFSVQFFEDYTAFTFALQPQDIAPAGSSDGSPSSPVTNITAQLVEEGSGAAISLVEDIKMSARPITLAGPQVFSARFDQPAQHLVRHSFLRIVSHRGSQVIATTYVDLRSYCSSSRDHFYNMETNTFGCP